jgi:hypothetical protein
LVGARWPRAERRQPTLAGKHDRFTPFRGQWTPPQSTWWSMANKPRRRPASPARADLAHSSPGRQIALDLLPVQLVSLCDGKGLNRENSSSILGENQMAVVALALIILPIGPFIGRIEAGK